MWLKNGAIPPHRKHLENSMTELSESITDILLLTYSLSSALMTSHQRHSLRQQLSQAFIDKSINKWRRRLECVVQQNGGQSNICLNN